jgi:predicted esterase
VENDRRNCAVFGFSNGGAFAVAMGCRHPDRFGQVIAFSVAKSPLQPILGAKTPDQHPRFYLAAGRRGAEKMFKRHTLSLAKSFRRRGAECVFVERDAGHDFGFRQKEFVVGVSWAFAASGRHNSDRQ